jgi:hypothetical protein
MASEKLIKLMLEISKDPDKLDAFRKDPNVILSSVDISSEERDVLASGDQDKLQQMLNPSLIIAPVVYV